MGEAISKLTLAAEISKPAAWMRPGAGAGTVDPDGDRPGGGEGEVWQGRDIEHGLPGG